MFHLRLSDNINSPLPQKDCRANFSLHLFESLKLERPLIPPSDTIRRLVQRQRVEEDPHLQALETMGDQVFKALVLARSVVQFPDTDPDRIIKLTDQRVTNQQLAKYSHAIGLNAAIGVSPHAKSSADRLEMLVAALTIEGYLETAQKLLESAGIEKKLAGNMSSTRRPSPHIADNVICRDRHPHAGRTQIALLQGWTKARTCKTSMQLPGVSWSDPQQKREATPESKRVSHYMMLGKEIALAGLLLICANFDKKDLSAERVTRVKQVLHRVFAGKESEDRVPAIIDGNNAIAVNSGTALQYMALTALKNTGALGMIESLRTDPNLTRMMEEAFVHVAFNNVRPQDFRWIDTPRNPMMGLRLPQKT